MRAIVFCLMVSMLASGCGGGDAKDGGEERVPIDVGAIPCPDGNTLTWENFGQPFLMSQCVGCHSSHLGDGQRAGAPVGVDFDTYELTRQWGSRIYVRAGTNVGGMPPAGGPCDSREDANCDAAYDRLNLTNWLACDAPMEADLD